MSKTEQLRAHREAQLQSTKEMAESFKPTQQVVNIQTGVAVPTVAPPTLERQNSGLSDNDRVIAFLKEKTVLNRSEIARAAGMLATNSLSNQIQKGVIPKKYLDKIVEVLKEYGFQ